MSFQESTTKTAQMPSTTMERTEGDVEQESHSSGNTKQSGFKSLLHKKARSKPSSASTTSQRSKRRPNNLIREIVSVGERGLDASIHRIRRSLSQRKAWRKITSRKQQHQKQQNIKKNKKLKTKKMEPAASAKPVAVPPSDGIANANASIKSTVQTALLDRIQAIDDSRKVSLGNIEEKGNELEKKGQESEKEDEIDEELTFAGDDAESVLISLQKPVTFEKGTAEDKTSENNRNNKNLVHNDDDTPRPGRLTRSKSETSDVTMSDFEQNSVLGWESSTADNASTNTIVSLTTEASPQKGEKLQVQNTDINDETSQSDVDLVLSRHDKKYTSRSPSKLPSWGGFGEDYYQFLDRHEEDSIDSNEDRDINAARRLRTIRRNSDGADKVLSYSARMEYEDNHSKSLHQAALRPRRKSDGEDVILNNVAQFSASWREIMTGSSEDNTNANNDKHIPSPTYGSSRKTGYRRESIGQTKRDALSQSARYEYEVRNQLHDSSPPSAPTRRRRISDTVLDDEEPQKSEFLNNSSRFSPLSAPTRRRRASGGLEQALSQSARYEYQSSDLFNDSRRQRGGRGSDQVLSQSARSASREDGPPTYPTPSRGRRRTDQSDSNKTANSRYHRSHSEDVAMVSYPSDPPFAVSSTPRQRRNSDGADKYLSESTTFLNYKELGNEDPPVIRMLRPRSSSNVSGSRWDIGNMSSSNQEEAESSAKNVASVIKFENVLLSTDDDDDDDDDNDSLVRMRLQRHDHCQSSADLEAYHNSQMLKVHRIETLNDTSMDFTASNMDVSLRKLRRRKRGFAAAHKGQGYFRDHDNSIRRHSDGCLDVEDLEVAMIDGASPSNDNLGRPRSSSCVSRWDIGNLSRPQSPTSTLQGEVKGSHSSAALENDRTTVDHCAAVMEANLLVSPKKPFRKVSMDARRAKALSEKGVINTRTPRRGKRNSHQSTDTTISAAAAAAATAAAAVTVVATNPSETDEQIPKAPSRKASLKCTIPTTTTDDEKSESEEEESESESEAEDILENLSDGETTSICLVIVEKNMKEELPTLSCHPKSSATTTTDDVIDAKDSEENAAASSRTPSSSRLSSSVDSFGTLSSLPKERKDSMRGSHHLPEPSPINSSFAKRISADVSSGTLTTCVDSEMEQSGEFSVYASVMKDGSISPLNTHLLKKKKKEKKNSNDIDPHHKNNEKKTDSSSISVCRSDTDTQRKKTYLVGNNTTTTTTNKKKNNLHPEKDKSWRKLMDKARTGILWSGRSSTASSTSSARTPKKK